MIREQRKKLILNMLNDHESVSVQEIVKECGVSEITARRDLEILASDNLLIRTHGGAVKSRTVDHLFHYDMRFRKNMEKKTDICRKASEHIHDNDIIFIDCGTTLYHLSKFITTRRNLTVITNSLPVVSELINLPEINLILIGGNVINERKAIYGPAAGQFISLHHATKAFIGADGVSVGKGLSSYDMNEASITLKMAQNADEVFLLCDSSKIEKNSFMTFASLEIVNYLVTDNDVSKSVIEMYKKCGIEFIIT